MMSTKEKNDSGRLNTIIGSGSVFEGTLHIESGGVRVDGKVKGKLISSETLVVGPTGVIEANIQVKRATIGGRVVGSLVAMEQAVLESKAVLLGDLKTSNLVVHEGAVFNGNCSMGQEKSLLEKRDKLYTTVSGDEAQDQGQVKKTF